MNPKQLKRLQNLTRILANRCSVWEHPFFKIEFCGQSVIVAGGTENDLFFGDPKVVVATIGPKGGLKVRTNVGKWYVR
jgi:hypothetical protein